MRFARRSVSDADIRRYEMFAQNMQQQRGFGTFKFPESSGANQPMDGVSGAGESGFGQEEGDDDLYA